MSYTPIGFSDGQYLTGAELNYIEAGIVDSVTKTGNDTKTGGLEVTNGVFASGFDVGALPDSKNGVSVYWNSTTPIGGVTGGIGRIASFIKSVVGVVTYKALGLGACVSNKFSLLLNPDGSAVFGGTVTLDSAPTSDLHAATKAYVDSDWASISETWAYASATTITVPSGATSRYQKFDKIRYTQSGSVKYGRVLSVSSTLLTLIPSTTYSVANSAISSISISRKATPFGFPAISNWKQSFATAGNVVSQLSCNFSAIDNNGLTMNMFFAATGSYISNTQAIFTLPNGFRPSEQILVPMSYQLAGQSVRHPCDLQINTNGVCNIFYPLAETVVQYLFGNVTILL